MKKLVLFTVLLSPLFTSATGGMWPPFMFDQIKKDLKKSGLKLNIEELYNENKESLKDAVVVFGGGCTGEVISSNGLVLTNHHCGYGAVQRLSSIQNNYLTNGYFAKNIQEEIPCPGLSVTFIISYTDVTSQILNQSTVNLSPAEKQKSIDANIKKILDSKTNDKKYEYEVSNFYQGNTFYLIKKEKFNDIRLVVFPPNGIGKFGGDTDNWAWPRHTGDFGLFRIYANKNNESAVFNKDNIPYTPKKYFTLNADGAKDGAFTMVYGFPGRTQEYVSSAELESIIEVIDPTRVKLREKKLNIWNQEMNSHEEIFVKYASKQASVANYWKKWKGEILGLKSNNALVKKEELENDMRNRIASLPENDLNRKRIYVLDSLKLLFSANKNKIKAFNYYQEALQSFELLSIAGSIAKYNEIIKKSSNKDSVIDYMLEDLKGFYSSYDAGIDKSVTKALYADYYENLSSEYWLDYFKSKEDITNEIDLLFNQSIFTSLDKVKMYYKSLKKEDQNLQTFTDPLMDLFKDVNQMYNSKIKTTITEFNDKKNDWNAQLMNIYFDMNKEKALFPDANFSLRLTYGRVEGVCPSDGMCYTSTTTLDGIPAKYNPNVEEFDAPKRLLEIQKSKDYGKYMKNKTVPVAFLASNHTTGGNSGSPVLNNKGELIGTNFDRIWEGVMSDLYFDSNICRNISVNIRYTLFVIDQFGGAGWLLNEMNIKGL